MFTQTLHVVGAVWLPALLGTGLLVVAAGTGWALGQAQTWPPVRLVAWWVRRIVIPLLTRRSWLGRTITVFVNNISILALLTFLSRWHIAALVGITAIGLSLGIGLAVLAGETVDFMGPTADAPRSIRRTTHIGLALNLLEPPAIMLTVGMALARWATPLTPQEIWWTFAIWIVPMSLLAAGGEALWIGSNLNRSSNDDGRSADGV